jgi:hypothetical protein
MHHRTAIQLESHTTRATANNRTLVLQSSTETPLPFSSTCTRYYNIVLVLCVMCMCCIVTVVDVVAFITRESSEFILYFVVAHYSSALDYSADARSYPLQAKTSVAWSRMASSSRSSPSFTRRLDRNDEWPPSERAVIKDLVSDTVRAKPVCPTKSCGCAVNEFFVVSSASTERPRRSISTCMSEALRALDTLMPDARGVVGVDDAIRCGSLCVDAQICIYNLAGTTSSTSNPRVMSSRTSEF